MSKSYLKNFLKIKDILSNEETKQIFIKKFKMCFTNILSEDKINNILADVISIGDMNIGLYIPNNVSSLMPGNLGIPKCYADKVIYGSSTLPQPTIKSNYVYYTFDNTIFKNDSVCANTISNFCENNKYDKFINTWYYKLGENIILSKDTDKDKYKDKVHYEISGKRIGNIGSYIFSDKNVPNPIKSNYLSDSNFDSYYYYYIEKQNGIEINLSKYVHFLIEYMDYVKILENVKIDVDFEESLQLNFNSLKKDYSQYYVYSPFDELKSSKIETLEKKYGEHEKLKFINQPITKKPKNNTDIFEGINIDLNLNDPYTKQIQNINKELDYFYSLTQNDTIQMATSFINLINNSYDLIKKIGMDDYKSKILTNQIIKLPLLFLQKTVNLTFDIKENGSIIKNIYICFRNWINICELNNSINIYKYSYLLLINNILKSNFNDFSEYVMVDLEMKNKILEEFMIDINSSVLTSQKLFEHIQIIKKGLEQITIWYTETQNYQLLLDKIYELMIKEKVESKSIVLNSSIKTLKEPMDLLTTKDLSESNNFFNNLSKKFPEKINFEYFKNSDTYKPREIGIINNAPLLKIDKSCIIFKFIDLNSIDINKSSNIFLMWIQMINNCKMTSVSQLNFPYQFPDTSVCELLIKESNIEQVNKITYSSNYIIIKKTLENKYTNILDKLDTFGSDTKDAYIDYFFNYLSTDNKDYLNTIINPFVNYGLELIKSDELNYIPVNYNNSNSTNLLIDLDTLKSKKNFVELLNIFESKIIEKEQLESLDERQFNILFFVYTSIKNINEIIKLINKDKNTFKTHLYCDVLEFEKQINMVSNDKLKLIYVSNRIKYYYFLKVIEKTPVYNNKISKLLELLTKVYLNIFESTPIDKEYSNDLECNSYIKNIQFINYSLPYLEFLDPDYIKFLKKGNSIRKLLFEPFSRIIEVDKSNSKLEFINEGIKDGIYKINLLETFDNTLSLINHSYKTEKIFKNFFININEGLCKLYPKYARIAVSKKKNNIGFFIGDDDNEYLNENLLKDGGYSCIDIENYRPKPSDEITLEQIIKINPKIPYATNFIEIFKYLIKLNELNGNKNIKPKKTLQSDLYDVTELDEEQTDFLPPLEKPIDDISKINFSNGYYQFKINETSDTIYYRPSGMDIVLEYLAGMEIRFVVHNGTCVKYYIDGISREQDTWINELYSMFVHLVRISDPRVILDSLKFIEYVLSDINNKYEFKFAKYEKKQIGGVDEIYTDKNLSLFFNKTIENYTFDLPTFKVKSIPLFEQGKTFEKTIVDSLFDLINLEKIYFDESSGFVFSNLVCDGNIYQKIPVFPSINYSQDIKKVYLSDIINEKSDRNIVICGKDLLNKYDIRDIVNIYNNSPDVIKDINDYDKILEKFGEVKIPLSISGGTKKVKDITLAFNEFISNDLKKMGKKIVQNENDKINIEKYLTQSNNYVSKYEYKYVINKKNFYSVKEISNNNLFNGIINLSGELKFTKPYYLDNPIFYNEEYFIVNNQGQYTLLEPTINNLLYYGDMLKVEDGYVKLISSKGDNEKIYLSLLNVEQINLSEQSFLNKLLNIVEDNSNILCWIDSTTRKISNVDMVNIGVRFNIIDDNIMLLNRYKILLNYEGIDWKILRWIYNDENNISNEENIIKSSFLAQNKNDYYLIVFFQNEFINIKIDSNTYLPIFNNSEALLLLQIIKYYKYNLDIIKDLFPLIIKNNLQKYLYGTISNEFTKLKLIESEKIEKAKIEQKIITSANYSLLTEKQREEEKINNEILDFLTGYESIDYLCENKLNYYLEYEFIDINFLNYQEYEKIFYGKFYFIDNKLKSFGDFMLYSLVNIKEEIEDKLGNKIKMNILTFNLFYYKMIQKIYQEYSIDISMDENSIQDILDNNDITILKPEIKPDGTKYFKSNPLEFYYQYIFGYFARDVQLQMANEIFTDITGLIIKDLPIGDIIKIDKSTSPEQFRLSKFIQINPNCFEIKNSNPNIHNLIMGAGKTSMITPLVIIKYLQLMTTIPTPKSNCYIVLPEKLVNQSCDKLASLFNLYFPVNLRKCIETRKNNDLVQKYNLTYLETLNFNSDSKLDKTNLNVFVMSDTSLKSGFINNYNLILDTFSTHRYLFDEVDTIINPLTSELNYPISETTKKILNLEKIFELVYKIYFKIQTNTSNSLKRILNKYPRNFYKLNPFTIINSNQNFISELKCWIREIISVNIAKDNKIIADIISYGLDKSNFQNQIDELDLDDLNYIYIINNFINVVFIPSLFMVNRVNYGTYFPSTDNNKINEKTSSGLDLIIKNIIEDSYKHQKNRLPRCEFEEIMSNIKITNSRCYELPSISDSNCLTENVSIGKNDELEKYLIIPFSNNEDPTIGSKFSNPIMTLTLTIINYITRIGQKNIIDNKSLKIIADIIYEQYVNSPQSSSTRDNIMEQFNLIFGDNTISITKIKDEYLNFTLEQIDKIKSNPYLIYLFCKKVCLESLTVDLVRFNVSGVDIMESTNILNRSGFSGTVKIPQIIDTNANKQLGIKLDDESISAIDEVLLTKCLIQIYNSNSNLLEELVSLIGQNQNINTIIDCGGVFVNISSEEIWNKLNVNFPNSKMYFWNNDDRPREFISTKVNSLNAVLPDKYENIDTENKTFYYYDQKHTTGIDAKIPYNSVGLVFLNKSSRYRDVVQSMFRMRKLQKSHSIIFCLTDIIAQNISLNESGEEITKLVDWFNLNEEKYFIEQQISCQIQNINTITRIIRSKERIYNNSNNKSCVLLSNNYLREIVSKDFTFNKEIIEGTKNWIELELLKSIDIIQPKLVELDNREQINTLIHNTMDKITHTDILNVISSQSQSQSQSQSVAQASTQTQTQTQVLTSSQSLANELEQIGEEKDYYDDKSSIITFRIPDYFKYNDDTFYTNLSENILYLSNNAKLYSKNLYPSTIIYLENERDVMGKNKILIVPNIEGFKLIDWLRNTDENSLPESFIILDSTGTIYLNRGIEDPEQISQIQSYIRIMLRTETNRNIISSTDIDNFKNIILKYSQSEQFINNISTHLLKSGKEEFKELVKKIKEWLDEQSK